MIILGTLLFLIGPPADGYNNALFDCLVYFKADTFDLIYDNDDYDVNFIQEYSFDHMLGNHYVSPETVASYESSLSQTLAIANAMYNIEMCKALYGDNIPGIEFVPPTEDDTSNYVVPRDA